MAHHEGSLTGYPKTIHCKDKTEIVVRPMVYDDLDRVRTFFSSLPRQDRLFLKDDVTRPEVFARWFAELDYERKLPLMAVSGDVVAGHALLDAAQARWSPHVAEIRVVVAPAFKKRAVGTILTRELFDQAATRGFEKVVAQMMDNQIAARKMFERIGFKVEAELEEHVKDLDGHKHTLVLMSAKLDDAWGKMQQMLEDFAPWLAG